MVPHFTEEERRAWTPFVIGVLHLLATLDAELKDAVDISHLDYGILMLLHMTSEHVRRMSDLALTFGTDPSNITYRVRRMEARGLVERTSSSTDGRVVYVHLTAEGLALLNQARAVHVQGARRHFLDTLDPAQLPLVEAIFGHLCAVQRLPIVPFDDSDAVE
ncbi:MAG: MarR family transcriptional regulator [Ktedonobacteraceae bacterium]